MKPPDPASVRALTVRLEPEAASSLLSATPTGGCIRYWSPRSLSRATLGTAATLALPAGLADAAALDDVVAWLRAVPHDDRVERPGSGVSAHGALPFDPTGPGRLVVPSLCVAQDDGGQTWATAVVAAGDTLDEQCVRTLVARAAGATAGGAGGGGEGATGPGPAPGSGPTVVPHPTPAGHARAVAVAVAAVDRGVVQKVVLARRLDVHLPAPADVGDVLRRLRAQEPGCTVFAHPVAEGWFVGASPELLLRRHGARVWSHPLAGTVGLTGTTADEQVIDAFVDSKKERSEHELVVEEIAAALRPHCDRLTLPPVPSLVRLQSVAHLGTLIEGRLARPAGPAHALELLASLHPTPAVAGVPRDRALALISELEPGSRGHWAGPVGWVDARGDGEWMLGIRSATLSGDGAVLWAGGGIVSGSQPEQELEETTIKLVPVLEAVAPGTGGLLRPRTTAP